MPVIAHVSDTHFGGPPDARDRAERILAHLLEMDPRPDALVVSGDIADHGLPEEYAEARAVLDTWDGPKIVGTGNHDVREQFVAQFGPAVGQGFSNSIILGAAGCAVDQRGAVDKKGTGKGAQQEVLHAGFRTARVLAVQATQNVEG